MISKSFLGLLIYYLILTIFPFSFNLKKPFFIFYEFFYFIFPIIFFHCNLKKLVKIGLLALLVSYPIGLISHNVALWYDAYFYPKLLDFGEIDFYGILWYPFSSFFILGYLTYLLKEDIIFNVNLIFLAIIISTLVFLLFFFLKNVLPSFYSYQYVLLVPLIPTFYGIFKKYFSYFHFKLFLFVFLIFLIYEIIGLDQFEGWIFPGNYIVKIVFYKNGIPLEEIIFFCVLNFFCTLSLKEFFTKKSKRERK